LARALSHPLRVRILELLGVENASAKVISQSLGVRLGDAAYHLNRVLDRECGLVRLSETNDRRGAREKVFALDQEAFRDLIDWDALPPALDDALKGASLKGFVNAAASAIDAGSLDLDAVTLCWSPVALDAAGWSKVKKAFERAEEEVRVAVSECAARLQAGEDSIQGVIGLAAFEAPGSNSSQLQKEPA
jgi:DNA-binding transcriptional ArsR family regulator